MAFPTAMSTQNYQSVAGITLGLFPSDPTFEVELQRSTAVAAPTSKWQTLQTFGIVNTDQIVYQDRLPYSTRLAYYRARHTKTGYTAGAYSTVVSAKPRRVFMNGQDPVFGTTSVGAAKSVRVGFAEFVAGFTTQKSIFAAEQFRPNTTGSTQTFVAPAVLPSGVTITGISFRYLRTASASKASFFLDRANSTAGVTALVTVNPATTGASYKSTAVTGLSEVVTSTKGYVIVVSLATTKVQRGFGAGFLYADITYTNPVYGAGV